jgi:hypothetical protein
MDTNQGQTPNAGGPDKQPQEELRSELEAMGRAAAELMDHLVKVPATLAQIPLQYLPDDTASHARNAAAEGFKAVKTLLDSISAQVDRLVTEQSNRASTRTGVGTPSGDDATGDETTRMGGSTGSSGPQNTVRLSDDDDQTH